MNPPQRKIDPPTPRLDARSWNPSVPEDPSSLSGRSVHTPLRSTNAGSPQKESAERARRAELQHVGNFFDGESRIAKELFCFLFRAARLLLPPGQTRRAAEPPGDGHSMYTHTARKGRKCEPPQPRILVVVLGPLDRFGRGLNAFSHSASRQAEMPFGRGVAKWRKIPTPLCKNSLDRVASFRLAQSGDTWKAQYGREVAVKSAMAPGRGKDPLPLPPPQLDLPSPEVIRA
jgi:hypothetical protein